MDITRDEANHQLKAMLLIEEPWTPEQRQEARRLQRLSWARASSALTTGCGAD